MNDRWYPLLVAVAVFGTSSPAAAQHCPDTTGAGRSRFIVLGRPGEDLLRRDELLGCARQSTLIRSPLTLSPELRHRADGLSVEPIYPDVATSWNSSIPFSINNGAQWAGRGTSASTVGGVRLHWRRIYADIAPEVVGSQNSQFLILPASNNNGRTPYANALHDTVFLIDAPLRFGYRGFGAIMPGQSAIEVRANAVAFGASSENLWWGPGLQNAIVMSNNAAGIPQLYLRTAKPLQTPIGSVEGRMILGMLTESGFFDTDPRNDLRSLSGAVATLRPAFDSNLTLGATRVAYATVGRLGGIARHAIDFVRVLPSGGRDELQSVFGRWAFPENGFEFHWEWSRMRLPSLRELLVAPQRTQGYTLGLQWAGNTINDRTWVRIQGEATMLEQTSTPDRSKQLTFYASRRVLQGYTQRGELIGAATGPGSSSQWVSAELFGARWTAGVEASRIRWENEAYYTRATALAYFAHDVSLIGGLKGGVDFSRISVNAQLLRALRMNYLFQSLNGGTYWDPTFDVHNTTLNLFVSYRR